MLKKNSTLKKTVFDLAIVTVAIVGPLSIEQP